MGAGRGGGKGRKPGRGGGKSGRVRKRPDQPAAAEASQPQAEPAAGTSTAGQSTRSTEPSLGRQESLDRSSSVANTAKLPVPSKKPAHKRPLLESSQVVAPPAKKRPKRPFPAAEPASVSAAGAETAAPEQLQPECESAPVADPEAPVAEPEPAPVAEPEAPAEAPSLSKRCSDPLVRVASAGSPTTSHSLSAQRLQQVRCHFPVELKMIRWMCRLYWLQGCIWPHLEFRCRCAHVCGLKCTHTRFFQVEEASKCRTYSGGCVCMERLTDNGMCRFGLGATNARRFPPIAYRDLNFYLLCVPIAVQVQFTW